MRRPADQALERRYRRLLDCYPAGYRAANAEEMLGVAMARWVSAPGRRWPDPGETVSLIVSGLGKRLGAAVTLDGLRDRIAWLDAAAALTVIGPLLLAAAAARTSAGVYPYGDLSVHAQLWTAGQAVGWALIALLACLGLRRLTAFGAVAGLASEGVRYGLDNQGVQNAFLWMSVLAAVTAVAGLGALRGERRPVLSPRTMVMLAITTALPAGWPSVQLALATWLPDGSDDVFTWLSTPLGSVTKVADVVWLVTAAIAMAVAVSRLRPAVRRRVMVALFPPLATFVLYGGFAVGSMRLGVLAPFGMLPWEALVVVPVPCFTAGLLWLGRYERMLRRVAREGTAS